jgi:UDP-3-O-[3-hydroxymyristoyl] glucosamine N-acyltransferase
MIMANRTAGDLARFLGCPVHGEEVFPLKGVASPEAAEVDDLIYLDSSRHMERVTQSAARCAITSPDLLIPGKTLIVTARPKLAFARAAAWLVPPAAVAVGIHPTAVIAESVRLGRGTAVGPFAVIEEEAEIAEETQIGAFCFLGRGTRVGRSCRLHPRVTVYAGVKIGSNVIVHSGAVLGCDGFGYVTDESKHWKFPQAGGLEIDEGVEIGANTTIARGSLGITRLAPQVKLDNLVHLAHNVQVGERTLVAAQTGIAGSSLIGTDVVIGGQVGIADHCELEAGCIAGAQAGIPSGKIIRRGQIVWGTPARPIKQFKEQYGWFARLPELAERVRKLEKETRES